MGLFLGQIQVLRNRFELSTGGGIAQQAGQYTARA